LLGQHGEVGDHLGQIYEKRGEKEKAIHTYALSLSGLRPIPETRGRLAGLVGGENQVDAIVSKYHDELQAMRTMKLADRPTLTGSAESFVLLSGGNSGASVDGVKLVSGEQKLRSFDEALRHLRFSLSFPDETPTKILRRGVLSCSQADRQCVYVLLLPDDVRSID
jgi:hypothetical protein